MRNKPDGMKIRGMKKRSQQATNSSPEATKIQIKNVEETPPSKKEKAKEGQ